MDFDDDGVAQKINGIHNANLVFHHRLPPRPPSPADRVDLSFVPDGHETVLTQRCGQRQWSRDLETAARPGTSVKRNPRAAQRNLEMKMRPGGREIENRGHQSARARLEFIPNLPAQHHRTLDGKDFVIAYGPQNRVDTFRATNVTTRTDPTADE